MKLNGRSDWTRTSGLVVPNHALYQLSYAPNAESIGKKIELINFVFVAEHVLSRKALRSFGKDLNSEYKS